MLFQIAISTRITPLKFLALTLLQNWNLRSFYNVYLTAKFQLTTYEAIVTSGVASNISLSYFWIMQQENLPNLHKQGVLWCPVPGSSVSVERLFRFILSKKYIIFLYLVGLASFMVTKDEAVYYLLLLNHLFRFMMQILVILLLGILVKCFIYFSLLLESFLAATRRDTLRSPLTWLAWRCQIRLGNRVFSMKATLMEIRTLKLSLKFVVSVAC